MKLGLSTFGLVLALAVNAPAETCTSTPRPQPDTTRPVLTGRMVYQGGDSLYLTDFAAQRTLPITFTTSARPGLSFPLSAPRNANFSPDGRWIVFSAVWVPNGQPARRDVFIATPDGSHLVDLTVDLNSSTPFEDARFAFDGSQVVFKQRYSLNSSGTAGAIMSMRVTLPTDSSSDPARIGPPTTLIDDGHLEYSQPSLSPSGRYLCYSVGAKENEAVYQKDLKTGLVAPVAAVQGVEAYLPLARDFTTTLYTGWANSTNKNDQLFLVAPTLRSGPLRLSFSDLNYNNSDPAVVDENNIIFSSNRCALNGVRAMKLYIGSIGTNKYWTLNIDSINAPAGDLLAPDYTPVPAASH